MINKKNYIRFIRMKIKNKDKGRKNKFQRIYIVYRFIIISNILELIPKCEIMRLNYIRFIIIYVMIDKS